MNIILSQNDGSFSGPSGCLPFGSDDEISHRLAMLIEGQCQAKNVTQTARKFGYTRQRYYQLLHLYKDQGALGLAPGSPGPKTDYRRTEAMIRLVIRHRFLNPQSTPAVIAQKLRQDHLLISQRSVERIIADYGLQKKTLRA